jgi:ADP-ribose pyrophosphatase YjhB (NUDIX family)
MIKWTFVFDQGNVSSEVKETEEDQRIWGFIEENPFGWLSIPGGNTNIMVNLSLTKCIARELIDETEKKDESEVIAPATE